MKSKKNLYTTNLSKEEQFERNNMDQVLLFDEIGGKYWPDMSSEFHQTADQLELE